MAVHKVIRFEGYALDMTRGCLSKEDREIDLRPKSFDVLCYLIENAGRLVSKDEIIKTVWPNVFVTDDSIKQCVSELRIALCDGEQRMIKTVPRRGYLFAAPIAEPGGPVEGPPSIAVLPFTNMGGDPQQDYFRMVSPRTSSRACRNSPLFSSSPSIRRSSIRGRGLM